MRIFGIETELGAGIWDPDAKRFSDESFTRRFMKFCGNDEAVGGMFLENGARLYVDSGDHLEYATPECDSVRQVVVYEKALDALMTRLVREFNKNAPKVESHNGTEVLFLKNNSDGSGSAYGCHENYLISSALWRELVSSAHTAAARIFLFFLAVRPILAGSGGLTSDLKFLFSPRAQFITRDINSASTGSDRPLIHTKDEPLLAGIECKRLHLIIADSLMSEWSSYLRVATTHLMLRALERAVLTSHLHVTSIHDTLRRVINMSPVKLLHMVNGDIACERKYANGTVDACDIHHALINFVDDMIGNAMDTQEEEMLWWWEVYVAKVQTRDEDFLASRLDWAIKKRIFEMHGHKNGIAPSHNIAHGTWQAFKSSPVAYKLRAIDLWYHRLAPEGIYYRLAARGAVERFLTDEEVRMAQNTPPSTTRAHWRGMALQYVRDVLLPQRLNVKVKADWQSITICLPGKDHVFRNDSPRVPAWSDIKEFIDQYVR
ncbi:MAG: proteasome accessory factor PafA2 family protein [Patescibacteria group bacterium]